ncbi:hypothetical protein C2S51_023346 [Perilla frutescens var. frutescens]|nr:hypothetical protein C2S51_023346 [Perilla frutescens var. frutescens]
MKYLPLDAKRDNEGKLTINEDGIGNTLSNAFEYMQHYGLTFESKLKFHGKCKLRTEYDPPKTGNEIYSGPNEKEWNAFFKAKSHMPPLKSPYEYHALVIIGHGVEGNIKYYIAKNSWGDEWGYKGFVKIAMDIKAPFYESMLYPSQPYLKQ